MELNCWLLFLSSWQCLLSQWWHKSFNDNSKYLTRTRQSLEASLMRLTWAKIVTRGAWGWSDVAFRYLPLRPTCVAKDCFSFNKTIACKSRGTLLRKSMSYNLKFLTNKILIIICLKQFFKNPNNFRAASLKGKKFRPQSYCRLSHLALS